MSTTASISDPALDRLLQRIVEVMEPLEVWLFGSRAEGRARPDSDYDLLVVLPDGTPEEALDPVRAWRIGRSVRVVSDIIPCRRSDFEDEKEELDTLPRAAVRSGRKLFERLPEEDPWPERLEPLLFYSAYATTYRYPRPGGGVPAGPPSTDVLKDVAALRQLEREVRAEIVLGR